MAYKLTADERERLAAEVIDALGNLAELAQNGELDCLAGVDAGAVRRQLRTWAQRIPGDAWDSRLDGEAE